MQGFRSFLERSLLFVNDFLKNENNGVVELLLLKKLPGVGAER